MLGGVPLADANPDTALTQSIQPLQCTSDIVDAGISISTSLSPQPCSVLAGSRSSLNIEQQQADVTLLPRDKSTDPDVIEVLRELASSIATVSSNASAKYQTATAGLFLTAAIGSMDVFLWEKRFYSSIKAMGHKLYKKLKTK